MKRLTVLTLCMLAFVCPIIMGLTMRPMNYVGTPGAAGIVVDTGTDQDEYRLMRTITASDIAFTTSTRTWNNAAAYFLAMPREWNIVDIAVYATGDGAAGDDPTSGTFSYTLYVARKWGPMEIVADGTWAIGGQLLIYNPAEGTALTGTYAAGELPVVSNDYWATTVKASGTTDQWGKLSFDGLGAWGVYLEVTSLADLTTLYVVATGR